MDKIKPSEPCDTHPFSDPEILKVIQSLLPQKGHWSRKFGFSSSDIAKRRSGTHLQKSRRAPERIQPIRIFLFGWPLKGIGFIHRVAQ